MCESVVARKVEPAWNKPTEKPTINQKFKDMIITFNELRRIKDKLPSGSSQRIADELGIDVETVRNYFGGNHVAKECVGVHFEPGPDGGVVTLDDTTILDVAMRILSELQH